MVALFPMILVTYLLLNKIVEQSREEVLTSLSNQVELQSELLEQNLNVQLHSLVQLSQISDVRLTPTSSLFGQQAGVQLKKFIQQSPITTAAYILDREHWPIEVYPINAELVDLNIISKQVDQFLQEVEQRQQIKPLILHINDSSIVQILSSKDQGVNIGNPWVMVIVQPLIQETQHASTKFKVVGSLITLEPYAFLHDILEKWKPEHGAIVLLDQDTKLYDSARLKEMSNKTSLISRHSTIHFADKTLVLNISQPSETLKAMVVDDIWLLSLIVLAVLLLASFISLMVTKRVGIQVNKLILQVQAFAQGNYQYRVSDFRFTELLQVSTVLERLAEKVITDQSELEKQVNQRTIALSKANTELNYTLESLTEAQDRLIQSEKMASLGQLVAGIAHELNTPLGVCVTATAVVEEISKNLNQMLSSGSLKKSELQAELQTLTGASSLIARNIQRSSDLVILFKELSPEYEDEGISQFELKSFLQQMSYVWLESPRLAGLSVEVTGDDILVQTHMGTLKKVLSLFFINALDHAFKHKTEEEFTPKIRLQCTNKKNMIELCFIDNGNGVDIDPIEKIFEPFYTSNRYKGNIGLGLHLAYNLVSQKLEGDLCAENSSQGGLKLCLKFPTIIRE